jgi:EmrB/QacA subfamily drug resistance transporter
MLGSPRHYSTWALILTCVAAFIVTLDALVVVTALPAIHRALGGSLDTLQWTVNAYTLAFAAGIMLSSTLADRFGRRKFFAAGLALFAASSAVCALSLTAEVLIAARIVQGLAGAIVAPIGLTILTSAYSVERRGAVVGVYGGVAGLAVASGPLVGGLLTQLLSWHAVFWVNVPIGLIAAALSLAFLSETYGPSVRVDLPAAILVSGGAVALVLGLVRAPDIGWTSPVTTVGLGLGVALLAGFVAWETRVAEPMLPLRLFRDKTFSAANATSFFVTGAQFAAAFLVAQYLQIGRGYSPMETGLRILPWTATPLFVAPVAGALSDRVGRRPLMLAGMVLQATGFAIFAVLAGAGSNYWQDIVPLVVAGVGASMVLPVAPAAVLSAVAPADLGRASAVNNIVQRFGTAFGVAAATSVFLAYGTLSTASTFTSGMRPALLAAAGLSLFGALCALAIREPNEAAAKLGETRLSAATSDLV